MRPVTQLRTPLLAAYNFGHSHAASVSICGAIAIIAATGIIGCGPSVGSQLSRRASPAEAAAAAMAASDKNNDGKIAADELDPASGLAAGLARIDTDKDNVITADELLARFDRLEKMSDMIAVSLTATGPKGPVSGATLTLVPEPFMGEGLQAYSGQTIEGGACELEGSEIHLPGVPVGYYRAHLVHSELGIDKTIGCEIAGDASGNRVQLKF